jgi:predicted ABC-class ATPase
MSDNEYNIADLNADDLKYQLRMCSRMHHQYGARRCNAKFANGKSKNTRWIIDQMKKKGFAVEEVDVDDRKYVQFTWSHNLATENELMLNGYK